MKTWTWWKHFFSLVLRVLFVFDPTSTFHVRHLSEVCRNVNMTDHFLLFHSKTALQIWVYSRVCVVRLQCVNPACCFVKPLIQTWTMCSLWAKSDPWHYLHYAPKLVIEKETTCFSSWWKHLWMKQERLNKTSWISTLKTFRKRLFLKLEILDWALKTPKSNIKLFPHI